MDLLIRYHAEDRLPGDAAALVEDQPDPADPARRQVDVYLSRGHDLAEVCDALGPALTEWAGRSYSFEVASWPEAI